LLAGCCTDCWFSRPCETIPQGAIPQPLGVKVHEFQERQATKAEYDDFVIYKHEWYKGGRELGPYGTYHLGEIIKRLPVTPFPVLLEVATDDPELNEARRSLIVNRLALAGIPNAEQQVIVGFPGASGLFGEEAEIIFQQFLLRRSFNQFGQGFGRNLFGGGFGGFGGFGGGLGLGGFGGFGGFGGGLGGFGGGFIR
jgi:hypothetical protein